MMDRASAPSSPSVLLAVEHDVSAELLADRLRRHGARVKRVREGEAARCHLQETPYAVVVAEAHLPGRTGLELLRAAPFLDPPFVLLGRRGNDEDVVRAFEMGAADYFTRPFAPRIAVGRILRVPRLTQASRNAPALHDSHLEKSHA